MNKEDTFFGVPVSNFAEGALEKAEPIPSEVSNLFLAQQFISMTDGTNNDYKIKSLIKILEEKERNITEKDKVTDNIEYSKIYDIPNEDTSVKMSNK